MMLPGHATVDEWRETGKSLVLAVSSTRGGNPASLGKAEREEDPLSSALHLSVSMKIIAYVNVLVGSCVSDIIDSFLCQLSSFCHPKFYCIHFPIESSTSQAPFRQRGLGVTSGCSGLASGLSLPCWASGRGGERRARATASATGLLRLDQGLDQSGGGCMTRSPRTRAVCDLHFVGNRTSIPRDSGDFSLIPPL